MSIASTVAAELARTFANAIRQRPDAKALHYRQRGPVSELWLVTEPVDTAAEVALHAASSLLYQTFPDVEFELHVLNPNNFDPFIPNRIIPGDAQRFPLR